MSTTTNNVFPLAGVEVGDRIGPHVATRAIKVRNKQATAMLEVSLALTRIKKFNDMEGSRGVISADLATLARYLYESAFSLKQANTEVENG